MHLNRIGPLALAALVCCLVFMVGCPGKNHDPVLTDITATPDQAVQPLGTVTLTATATDEDDDSLTLTWSLSPAAGALAPTTGDTVVWTAPDSAVSCTVKVVCDDGNDGTAEKTIVVSSRAWSHAAEAIDGATVEDESLPNPGTKEIVFIMDTTTARFPTGARVDSAFVNTLFDPIELEAEQFKVYAVSPAGTQVLVYDGITLTDLEVTDFKLADAEGDPCQGNWKLKIERTTAGVPGVAEECEIEIFYRY